MNLLNKYAISQEEDMADLTEEQSAEIAQQAEEVREEMTESVSDIQETNNDLNTAETALSQLREQNEVIRNVAEREEMTDAAAAGFALARQAAIAPLGLQKEEHAELVDEAGLESMVANKGIVALESNERMVVALEGVIGDMLAAIKNKTGVFLNRINKSISIISQRYKESYKVVRNLSEDEFNAKVSNLSTTSALRKYIENGKLLEIGEVTKRFKEFVNVSFSVLMTFDQYFKSKADDRLVKAIKDAEENLTKIQDISFGSITYKLSGKDFNLKLLREQGQKYTGQVNISKQDFLDALNMGAQGEAGYKLVKSYFDLFDKTINQVVENSKEDKPEGFDNAVRLTRNLSTSIMMVYKDLEEMRQDYIDFALSFK